MTTIDGLFTFLNSRSARGCYRKKIKMMNHVSKLRSPIWIVSLKNTCITKLNVKIRLSTFFFMVFDFGSEANCLFKEHLFVVYLSFWSYLLTFIECWLILYVIHTAVLWLIQMLYYLMLFLEKNKTSWASFLTIEFIYSSYT